MTTQQQTITTSDNTQIATTIFEPEQSNGRVVIINSAMGVRQRYYQKYATFLAEQGFTVITYDYRGIGDSAPANLRGYDAYLWQWGAEDFTAVIAWAETHHPEKSIFVVGHSVGGQLLGLTEKHESIAGLYGVAAQSGYWKNWQIPNRWLMFILWQSMPILCSIFGYLPKFVFGGGEHVPAGVAREWSQGGRSPRYIADAFRDSEHYYFDRVQTKIRLNSFADDGYAPHTAVVALGALYANAQVETCNIQPTDANVSKIGHFGFFRSALKDTLWLESIRWLCDA